MIFEVIGKIDIKSRTSKLVHPNVYVDRNHKL